MLRALAPVLALFLLLTSGCVAAALVGVAGAGAGYGYSQVKAQKTETPVRGAEKTSAVQGTQQATRVKLLPAPEFIDCKLQDGTDLAMSAADCRAKGGTVN